ncbi:MAG: PAS domain S-box protein [Phycisphaerales bacterium]
MAEVACVGAVPRRAVSRMAIWASGSSGVAFSDVNRRLDGMQGRTTTELTQCEQGPVTAFEKSFSQSLVDSLPCSFFALDPEGRFIRWNGGFRDLIEYSDPEIGSMHVFDVVPEENREDLAGAMRRAFDGDVIRKDLACRAKSGRVIPLLATVRRAAVEGSPLLIGTGWENVPHGSGERLLTDERSLLSTLIDNLPDAIYIKDRQSRFSLCNREVLRRKGVASLEEIVGRTDIYFYPAEMAQKFYADEQELMRSGQPLVNRERCVLDKNTGEPTWNLTTKVPLRNAADEIVGLVGIGRDITERRRAEDAYHAIVDHSLQGLIVVQNRRIAFANRAMEKITGYSAREMETSSPESIRDFVHPQDREMVWGSHEARLRGEFLPEQYEFRAIRKDGSVRWLQIHTSRVDYQGHPAIQAAFIDTTERRRAEEALRRSEARNLALLSANPDLMFRLSRGGVFLDCKPPKDDTLSASPAQFIGKHLDEVYPAPLTRTLMHCIEMAIQTGRVQTLEYTLPDADSEGPVFECRVVACAEQEVVAIVRDISDRRRAEHLAKLQRDLAIKLSSLSDLNEGLQYCLEAAVQASQMDCGGIYMLDERAGDLRLAVHVGLVREFVDRTATYPADSPHARVVQEGEPIYATYDALGVPTGWAHKTERLRAMGIIPVKHNGRVIACLNMASHTSDEVPQQSRVVLETIAAQIGCAISRLTTQEALRRAEREKAIILNTMPQIVVYHDISHRMIWANRTAIEAMGKPVDEIVGRPCYEVWDGRAEPCRGCPVDLALRTGCAQEAEILGYDDGHWLMRGEPVRDENGRLLGVVEHALDITRRKRDEEELRRRLQFEELAASISTNFANLRADEVEAGIGRVLADVGRFLDADHCSVFLLQDGGTRMREVYEWFAEEIDPEPDWIRDVETCRLSWGIEQLRRDRVLNIPSVRELQGQAADAKDLLESMGVKSLLCAPLMIGGQLFGLLDISVIRWERTWPDDAVQLLKITAETLANALERKRSAEVMRERLAFETLLSELSAAFINLPVDQLDGEIERWLTRIGESLDIDRAAIGRVVGGRATVTHSWVAPGQVLPSVAVAQEGFDWAATQLRTGGVLAFERIEDAPPEAEGEKEYCRRHGIKSIIAIPLEVGGSLLGILTLASVRTHRSWPDELIQRLRLVAQVFANAKLRRRAEEALRASETRLRSIVRATPAGIGLVSNRTMLEVNDRVCEMVGYRREELANKDARILYPTQEEYEYVGREAARQIEERGEGVIESRWQHRDGSIIHVLLCLAPLDPADLCQGITFAVLDVTARKQAEAALKESEQNYREVFNAANDAVLIHDPVTGVILDVNKTMLDIYGYTYEEALQCLPGRAESEDSAYSQRQALDRIHRAADGEPQLFEWLSKKKNGDPVWEEVNLRIAMIGGKRRVLAVVRDITDRKNAEAQAQQHLAELTRAWHANTLGEMASGLAHELNQPLCAIVNYSNGCLRLTRRQDYSMDTVKDSIERIAMQAQRAADIVKRIRGLIGRREPQRTALDLESILADAVYMLREDAAAHNVTIVSRLRANLPKIKGDNVEIEQVVLNLMRNAMEAMNDPEIAHRNLTISSCLTDRHEIEITVQDTGRGISPELSERVFDSFFTTKPGGLGIGLSLSRRIIEAHDGRLWAESDGRSGATFRFTLPVEGDTHGEG